MEWGGLRLFLRSRVDEMCMTLAFVGMACFAITWISWDFASRTNYTEETDVTAEGLYISISDSDSSW